MNQKSFMIALGLLSILAVSGLAQDSQPSRPRATTRPARPEKADRQLSEARMGELLDRMKEEKPEMYARMIDLRQNHPAAFVRSMANLDEVTRQLDNLPPELRETFLRFREDNVKAATLVRQIHDASEDGQKASLRVKLRDVVAQQFDDAQKLKEYRVQQLNRQLDNLRKELDERAAKRDEIIDGRTKELEENKPDRFW